MRLIFVTTNDHVPTGGSEELWSQAALHLSGCGVRIGVCAREWSPCPAYIKALLDSGCEFFPRARPIGGFIGRQYKRVKERFGLHEAKQFRNWAREFRPDLIVFSQGNPFHAYDYISECANSNLRYVLLVQNASEHMWQHGIPATYYERAYAHATKCFFVAKGNQLLVEKILGLRLNSAEVVQNPYNVSFDRQFRWDGLPGDEFHLASVASLNCHHKGQDILLEVLRDKKWRERSISVDLFGEGIHESLIRRLIKLWRIENVRIRGFVNDIEGVWDSHHALVMPSRMEGTPLALVEAQLCGRPAIVTDVGGNAEVVQDEINGFVAAAPTAALFDEAMERAWQRRENWLEMGQAAFRIAHQRISPDPAKDFADRITKLVKAMGTSS